MKIKLPFNRTDILPISCLSIIGISIFTYGYTTNKVNSLNKKMELLTETLPATLYQTCDGETELAKQYPHELRRSELVTKYALKWIEEQFTWSGQINNGKSLKSDPGILINRKKYPGLKVPTSAYKASFAFAPENQDSYLKHLAEHWVAKDYFSKNPTVTQMIVSEVSPVEKIEISGKKRTFYSIKISAILKEYKSGNPTGDYRHWKREIILASIRPLTIVPKSDSSIYHKLSFRWRSYGLEIYDIKPVN